MRHLQVVEAISRAGTATRAAKRLHLTQPAVSHALKELERRLGVELFHREHSGMVPTEEGLRLLETADRVLEELARAEHDLEQFREGRRGTLRLTTECYTCYHWLPSLLGVFAERFPEVVVELAPDDKARPHAALRAGEIDAAVVHSTPADPEIEYTPLFEDELVVVVAPDHPLAAEAWIEAEHFQTQTLVLHFGLEESVAYQHVMEPAGIRPPRVLRLPLTGAIVEAVKAGIGISVLARWTIAPELESGAVVGLPLTRGGLFRTWYAAIRRRDRRRAALRAFLELLTEEAGAPAGVPIRSAS